MVYLLILRDLLIDLINKLSYSKINKNLSWYENDETTIKSNKERRLLWDGNLRGNNVTDVKNKKIRNS